MVPERLAGAAAGAGVADTLTATAVTAPVTASAAAAPSVSPVCRLADCRRLRNEGSELKPGSTVSLGSGAVALCGHPGHCQPQAWHLAAAGCADVTLGQGGVLLGGSHRARGRICYPL